MMEKLKTEEIRQAVRQNYGAIAKSNSTGCGCGCGDNSASCCLPSGASTAAEVSGGLGYSQDEVGSIPEGANLGLGCGNPQAIASLKPGETVLDLGSGGGFDCFLASRSVGEAGRVIGVDMTPEMISKARDNAERGGYKNVDFRLGEIEHLPVPDNSVDVIISNCVINLSPEKPDVFKDAFRALKPGGRVAVSDIVALNPLPEELRNNMNLFTGCVAGASLASDIEHMMEEAGFAKIEITPRAEARESIEAWMPGENISDYITSASIEAVKPE